MFKSATADTRKYAGIRVCIVGLFIILVVTYFCVRLVLKYSLVVRLMVSNGISAGYL